MTWHFKHLGNGSLRPALIHCTNFTQVALDTDNKPYCYRCKEKCPDDIITQGMLLNAIVWDRESKQVYQIGTGKRGWI